ncbi:MAG: translation initiation factor IF-6 [Nanohaloarchaea archaeon SW_7_43_1]|nr:MAG: translation initiation factor IF-6 [Nanohaloarchaea archaeon SW_7_43_1]
MEIEKYNYQGDTNVGFYATVNNSYAVIPRQFEEKEYFPEKTVQTRIAGTNLVGLFTAGNSNCLLLPESVKEREVEKIEESGINYHILDSIENALGNIILVNDRGAVISPELEDRKKEIAEALGVEVEIGEIGSIENPGVCGVVNSKGAVIHRDASTEEAEHVKEVLQLEDINIGTINMGSPYIGSGSVASDDFILVGHDTTGPEIGRLDRVTVERD